jgi:hypothetical protein
MWARRVRLVKTRRVPQSNGCAATAGHWLQLLYVDLGARDQTLLSNIEQSLAFCFRWSQHLTAYVDITACLAHMAAASGIVRRNKGCCLFMCVAHTLCAGLRVVLLNRRTGANSLNRRARGGTCVNRRARGGTCVNRRARDLCEPSWVQNKLKIIICVWKGVNRRAWISRRIVSPAAAPKARASHRRAAAPPSCSHETYYVVMRFISSIAV